MDVLLTFVGKRDPRWEDARTGERRDGPILSLLSVKRFDRVEIFYNAQTRKNAFATEQALADSGAIISPRDLPLNDPTDYINILRGLRRHLHEIMQEFPEADFFIAEASGTPQMQSSWLLLAACGFITAKILQARPPEYVDEDHPLVSEVNFRSPEFPVVRPVPGTVASPIVPPQVIREAMTKLAKDGCPIIGEHPSFKKAIETAAAASRSDKPVLLLGETGTGKQLFAKLVHELSEPRRSVFLEENCAAIPETTAESELFGYERGAFTGAVRSYDGRFIQADNGTLFLDELDKLPLSVQGKLLKAIEDQQIRALGSKKVRKVNVRVIAATNRLREALLEGRFLEDLYYRVNTWEVEIPPLRKRRSDIPLLANHFVEEYDRKYQQDKRLSAEALERLQSYGWPGNVRELANVVEKSCGTFPKAVLGPEDLVINDGSTDPYAWLPDPDGTFSLEDFKKEATRQMMTRAHTIAGGNTTKAADLLRISYQHMRSFQTSEGLLSESKGRNKVGK